MADNLLKLLRKHVPSLLKINDDRLAPMVAKISAMQKPTLAQFDDTVTRVAGGSSPPFPLPSGEAYYTWASSDRYLKDVRVPLLALNAKDDPVIGYYPLDVGSNGYVALACTTGGGHLGWFESDGGYKVRRWVTRPILEWMRAVNRDLQTDALSPLHIIQNGDWLYEIGREHLGIKSLGDVGEVIGIEGEEGLLAGL